MHPIWWFLIVITALIVLIEVASAVEEYLRHSRAQDRAMMRRLGKFEAEQRVRQQAVVMQRTREINAKAHETCHAMLRAALDAQRKELDDNLE